MLAHRGSEVGDNLKDGDIGVYASELDIRSRLEYSWIQAPGAMGALRNLQPLTLAPHNMKKQLESESVENQGFSLRAYIVCAHHFASLAFLINLGSLPDAKPVASCY